MASSLTLKFGVLLIALASVYGSPLDCFICDGVSTSDGCHNVDVCKTETQKCYTGVSGTAGNLTFTYGCKEEAECLSPKAGIVGRRDSNTDCHQCCALPACNKVLCSHVSPIQHTPDNSTCEDDPTINCESISALFHVCDDIHHAKQVCKKWCGLCDLVDGNWGAWSSWSGCSVSCENGTRTRNRTCDSPAPEHGGLDCVGEGRQFIDCSLKLCPVHGQWAAWANWSECSATCGYGITKRFRYCNNPPPERFGQHCFGEPAQVEMCTNDSCVLDGGWSDWSSWATCSSSCGVGMTSQVRSCTVPKPKYGGSYCEGDHNKYDLCDNGKACIVSDRVYTAWSEWLPCETNIQLRNRTCFVFSDVLTTLPCNDTDTQTTVQYRPCGQGLSVIG